MIFSKQWALSLSSQRISFLSQARATFCTCIFTLIKGFWDDSLNYRPIPSCTCGANCTFVLNKILSGYQHYDYIISFLMGLNDSFAQVRGQILLMEPLPLINKVFSLVQQDEKQRSTRIFPLPTVDTTTLL